MAGRLTIELMDADRQRVQTSFDGVDFTAGNYTAQVALQDALYTAIIAITLGTVASTLSGGNYNRSGNAAPTNPQAQTSIQWRFVYKDAISNQVFTTRVGTADLALAESLSNSDGTLYTGLNLAAGAGLALKTAFDGLVRTEAENAVNLVSCVFVD